MSPDLRGVSFDEDALAQILDNLVDNAEKHTRSAAARTVRVSAARHGTEVRITVSDNGPGVPRHLRRKIFRPFDRPGQSGMTPGLGLGLALSRSLARAQGGELELMTNHAPGAAFVLTLPVA